MSSRLSYPWNKLFLMTCFNDDVIKWKHFPRYWPFVRGIHRSPGSSPHKGQWRGALMFSLTCVRINGWINNREAGDLRRHRAHYDVLRPFNIFFRNDLLMRQPLYTAIMSYFSTLFSTASTHINSAKWCLEIIYSIMDIHNSQMQNLRLVWITMLELINFIQTNLLKGHCLCLHSFLLSSYGLWIHKTNCPKFTLALVPISVRNLESDESDSGADFMVSRTQILFQKIWSKQTRRISNSVSVLV